MKLFLYFILGSVLVITFLSFKLPEIKVYKLLSPPTSKSKKIDNKRKKPIIVYLKIVESNVEEETNFGIRGVEHFSKFQLIMINIFTVFLIFLVFLMKIKHYDDR